MFRRCSRAEPWSARSEPCDRWTSRAAIGTSDSMNIGLQLCLAPFLIGALCGACSDDDDDGRKRESDAATEGDAQSAPKSSPKAMLVSTIDSFNRSIDGLCTCYAAAGAFPSAEQCRTSHGSRPEWTECGSKFVAEHDSPELRDAVGCFAEHSLE